MGSIISKRFPFPPDDGNRKRTIEIICDQKHETDISDLNKKKDTDKRFGKFDIINALYQKKVENCQIFRSNDFLKNHLLYTLLLCSLLPYTSYIDEINGCYVKKILQN